MQLGVLFTSQIPPDEQGLPQQLCSECYSKCEQWDTFRKMCQEVNQHLQRTIPIPACETPILIKDEPQDYDEYDEVVQETSDGDLNTYTFGQLIEDPEAQPMVLLERIRPEKSDSTIVKHKTSPDTSFITPAKVTDWECLVCQSFVPESIHLRDHLKEHYSEEVSSQY